MTSVSADRPRAWTIAADSPNAGLQIDLLKQTVVLPWSQFLFAEGDDTQVRLTFSTHEVTVKGSGLAHLLSDMREERVVLLAEPGRTGRFIADSGPRITGVSVRKIE
jgi:hypothetical protein